MNLIATLKEKLNLKQSGLVGCRRKGAWDTDDAPLRYLAGNAILDTLGYRWSVYLPTGIQECYLRADPEGGFHLLQFRGGPWRLEWFEDFLDLWAIVQNTSLPSVSRTILVIHEDKGVLDVKEMEVPETFNPDHRYQNMLLEAQADPPGRIPKNGIRARRSCPYCPHKTRCDALDTLRGDTLDYSPYYPMP